MTMDEIKNETRRRLAEIDYDLANDEVEVERRMPDVLRNMIEEADIASKHYKRIAEEAITPRYRKLYEDRAEEYDVKGKQLRGIKI